MSTIEEVSKTVANDSVEYAQESPPDKLRADVEPYPPPLGAWMVVAMLCTLCIISVLDRNIVTLLVEPIKTHFDLSETQMSLLIGAAFAVPFGVLSLPMGYAVDRMQRRHIIAAGITTWSLATIATGLVRSYEGLFVARSCVGAGDATLGPCNASILSDLFPREKLALPMAVASMGFKAGQGAALMAGAALMLFISPDLLYDIPIVGTLKGWQLIFIIVGVPGLLFIPLIFLMKEPIRRSAGKVADNSDSTFSAYFRFVRQNLRLFIPHHLGVMLLIAMAYTIIAWMPAFLIRVHGLEASVAGGWLGTAFLVGPLLGMPLHGAFADHLFQRGWSDIHMRYPMIAATLAAPVGVSAFIAPTPELAVILTGIFIFIVSGYVSLPNTAIISVMPSRLRGKTASIFGLLAATPGTIIGPLIVGALTDLVFKDSNMVGFSIMTSMAILAPLVVICFYLSLRPLRELSTSTVAP